MMMADQVTNVKHMDFRDGSLHLCHGWIGQCLAYDDIVTRLSHKNLKKDTTHQDTLASRQQHYSPSSSIIP